jgi:hypothetical protein
MNLRRAMFRIDVSKLKEFNDMKAVLTLEIRIKMFCGKDKIWKGNRL